MQILVQVPKVTSTIPSLWYLVVTSTMAIWGCREGIQLESLKVSRDRGRFERSFREREVVSGERGRFERAKEREKRTFWLVSMLDRGSIRHNLIVFFASGDRLFYSTPSSLHLGWKGLRTPIATTDMAVPRGVYILLVAMAVAYLFYYPEYKVWLGTNVKNVMLWSMFLYLNNLS